MNLTWPYLLVAVALLLPPVPFSQGFQRTLVKSHRRNMGNVGSATRVWQNWADLLRAALGTYVLTHWALVSDPLQPDFEHKVLGACALVLGLGVLVQTLRMLRTLQIMAPVFYVTGVTLILGGPLQGTFAVVVGWVFALVGKNLVYQMPAMAGALVAADLALGFRGLPLMVNVGLIVVPLLIAVLSRRRLLFAAIGHATV